MNEKLTKEELLKKINEYEETQNKNIMGCSENWYSPIYAIGKVFTKDEIEKMTEKEINDLYKLADTIQEHLY